jgi:hypothetical protein
VSEQKKVSAAKKKTHVLPFLSLTVRVRQLVARQVHLCRDTAGLATRDDHEFCVVVED